MAQLASAFAWHAKGQGFEPPWVHRLLKRRCWEVRNILDVGSVDTNFNKC